MSTLLLTIGLACIIILIAMAALGLSWLIKGKSSMRPGACGRDPHQKKDDETCGTTTTCGLCKKEEDKEKKS